ncbi:unnamed protein product [Auanema sp. JU1783]|nr:unnamed protein product [Auanema sp. JU1783]
MGWIKSSLVITFVAVLSFYINSLLHTDHPIYISGTSTKKFEKVEQVFRANFLNNWEPEGSALTVYYKGEKVVDVWGGYADRSAARPWKKDTMTVVFSTSKAVSALCIAMLVDRGLLKYEDPIMKYWPDFGKNGKENITVQMAMSHMGGLPYFDEEITEAAASDHNLMREIIENERPKWPPGTMTGYHPYTYGWIVDQIIRHVDPKKRGIGQFLREEITGPNGIDFYFGLLEKEAHRVARITVASNWQRLSEIIHSYKALVYFSNLFKLYDNNTFLYKAATNPSWLESVHRCTFNNPDYYKLEQGAALGIGTARGLAEIFNLVVSKNLLSENTLEKLQHYHINETDVVFGDDTAKGHGFFYLPVHRAGVPFVVGHTGHGCQQVIYDKENSLVIAYVSNGLKLGLYDLCRTYYAIQNAVYDVIEGK